MEPNNLKYIFIQWRLCKVEEEENTHYHIFPSFAVVYKKEIPFFIPRLIGFWKDPYGKIRKDIKKRIKKLAVV
jgi:hypothetical protein